MIKSRSIHYFFAFIPIPLILLLLAPTLLMPALFVGRTAFAAEDQEPTLTIQAPGQMITLRRKQLLSRTDLTQIKLEDTPFLPKHTLTVSAVPIYALFQSVSVPKDASIQFHCLDGFSAPISRERLLNSSQNKAIAYLAIEKKDEKWPAINPKVNPNATPGPFAIVWKNPELSNIGREEWPFQVTGFEIRKSLAETYPALLPEKNLSQSSPIRRGFQVFTQNCFTCHTLNLQGDSKMGPDLNVPLSPVEYFHIPALKKLIRNPQALRHWPESKMKGFSEKEISDPELNDLISYLKYMSKRKVKEK